MSTPTDLIPQKDLLLEAMLPNVLFDGWSETTFRHAAAELNWDTETASALFPGGFDEARSWLDDWADRQMLKAIAEIDRDTMRVPQRVSFAIKARLDALAPYREAVRRALAARISPLGMLRASQAVYKTVDTIWYGIGDDSVDFNFYTKRASLASVYVSTVLYWLNDTSDGAQDTQDFINRSLKNVVRLPQAAKLRFSQAIRYFSAPFDLLRSGAKR